MITIPEYLPENLKEEFKERSNELTHIQKGTSIDGDALARYLIARQQYLMYTSQLSKASAVLDLDKMERLTRLQEKALRQCRQLSADLDRMERLPIRYKNKNDE